MNLILNSLQLPKPYFLGSSSGDGYVVEREWECIAISIGLGVCMKHLMVVIWTRGGEWEFSCNNLSKKEWT